MGIWKPRPCKLLRQLVTRLPDSQASWLQYLGKVARSQAGFQHEFVKAARCVENSCLVVVVGGSRYFSLMKSSSQIVLSAYLGDVHEVVHCDK